MYTLYLVEVFMLLKSSWYKTKVLVLLSTTAFLLTEPHSAQAMMDEEDTSISSRKIKGGGGLEDALRG